MNNEKAKAKLESTIYIHIEVWAAGKPKPSDSFKTRTASRAYGLSMRPVSSERARKGKKE